MNWVSQIKNHRKKVYSQCGEEGFIEFILQNIGVDIPKMVLIEYGAGDGVSLSNSQYFIDKGCRNALRYDGDNKGNESVEKVWLNKIEAYSHGLEFDYMEFDLFLVDLDGNDYYLIEEFVNVVRHKPKLIVCEINPIWKRNEAAIIPYNENHVWNNDDYYGMSLMAAEVLLEGSYGYKLVFVNDSLNAYFVRAELLPDKYTTDYDYKVKKDHPHNKTGEWIVITY